MKRMNYETFKDNLADLVSERLGEDYDVDVVSVRKNNGNLHDTLSILKKGTSVCPAIYLEPFYESLQLNGFRLDEIVDGILKFYWDALPSGDADVEDLYNLNKVGRRIICRLVNSSLNRKLLADVPHKNFVNLAKVCCISLDGNAMGSCSVLIHKEHMEKLGLDEDTLFALGEANTRRLCPVDFVALSQVVRDLKAATESSALTKQDTELEENMPLYVLTNKKRSYGAVWVTDKGVLKRISEFLSDDFYILPSSVHECMIVPRHLQNDVEQLARMVTDINEEHVEPEEVLADNVYCYHRIDESLEIAA